MYINTDYITYDKEKNVFVGELSDLNARSSPESPTFHQIYDDAADVGLVLISHKTASEATFYLYNEVYGAEDEFLYYELRPTPETIRKYPQLKQSKVLIYND